MWAGCFEKRAICHKITLALAVNTVTAPGRPGRPPRRTGSTPPCAPKRKAPAAKPAAGALFFLPSFLIGGPPKRNNIERFPRPGRAQSASPITQKTANKKRERILPSFALCHSKNENARQAGAPKGLNPSKKQ